MSSSRFLFTPNNDDARSVREIAGGKAAGLVDIAKTGFMVPEWVAITPAFFVHVLRDVRDESNPEDMGKLISKLELEQSDFDFLTQVYQSVSGDNDAPLVVRSSAVCEDSPDSSFAGIFDSVLGVDSFAGFLDAFKIVWASRYADKAMVYCSQRGIDSGSMAMAIIVQKMIPADSSGLLFTVHPSSPQAGTMVIQSVPGLACDLAAGAVEGDTFFVSDTDFRSEPVRKKKKVVHVLGHGLEHATIPNEMSKTPSITRRQAQALYDIGSELRSSSGQDQDIEFAFLESDCYILQSRPVTKIGNPVIWDNSNIIESYTGVTTPLTFSFIRQAYARVYRQFCKAVGVNERTLTRMEPVFQNMLGFPHYHVYYNLNNWYKVISTLPGMKYNAAFMEQMMGVATEHSRRAYYKPPSLFDMFFIDLPRIIVMTIRLLVIMLTMTKSMSRFYSYYKKWYRHFDQMDFAAMDARRMLDVRREMDNRILAKWITPILNDLKTMIFHGVLRKLAFTWGVDSHAVTNLLTGSGRMLSVEIIKNLIDIARKVGKSPDARKLFQSDVPPQAILDEIKKRDEFRALRGEIGGFLKTYGSRSFEEMKLESIPLRDQPDIWISVIKNHLDADADLPENEAQSVKIELGPIKRMIFRWIARHSRQAIRDRENQRFYRAQIYDVARRLSRAAGRLLTEMGALEQSEDVFFLELDEIEAYINGTSTYPRLHELAQLRKEYHEECKKVSLPDRFDSHDGFSGVAAPVSAATGNDFDGVACSPGYAEGEAVVLLAYDAHADVAGKILVAKETDPGWVLLFPGIKGLVVERGSLLSHSSIIAREMGIPAVVGVRGITSAVESGRRLKVNGTAGSVTQIEDV